MKRVMAWAMFLSFALLPAGAALLLSWQDATAQSEDDCPQIAPEQDDIIVKPGGGKGFRKGDRLIWCRGTSKLKPGDPYSFRNDLRGGIQFFEIMSDDMPRPQPAKRIRFVIKDAGVTTEVTLHRSIFNNFKWNNDRDIDFKDCGYDGKGDHPCYESGVPPFFMGELQDNITGTLMDGTEVADVTYIHLHREPFDDEDD